MLCQFELAMFVLQPQPMLRVTEADRVESGHCNQTEISDCSRASVTDNLRTEKTAGAAAACMLAFDLVSKGGGGGLSLQESRPVMANRC